MVCPPVNLSGKILPIYSSGTKHDIKDVDGSMSADQIEKAAIK